MSRSAPVEHGNDHVSLDIIHVSDSRRLEALEEMRRLERKGKQVTRADVGFLWMGQEAEIEKFLGATEEEKEDVLLRWNRWVHTAVRRFTERSLDDPEGSTNNNESVETPPAAVVGLSSATAKTPSVRGGATFARSKIIQRQAKIRDQMCVLSGAKEALEVAHIYSFYLMRRSNNPTTSNSDREELWSIFENLFGKTKRRDWQAEFERHPGCGKYEWKETVKNVMTLTRNAHSLWNDAAWALKPIGTADDNLKDEYGLPYIEARFVWLPGNVSDQTRDFLKDIVHPEPIIYAPPERRKGAPMIESKADRDRPTRSGDVIRLSAARNPNPKTAEDDIIPPPSWHLLNLQYHLTVLRYLAGAAEESDSELDRRDGDDEHIIDWLYSSYP